MLSQLVDVGDIQLVIIGEGIAFPVSRHIIISGFVHLEN